MERFRRRRLIALALGQGAVAVDLKNDGEQDVIAGNVVFLNKFAVVPPVLATTSTAVTASSNPSTSGATCDVYGDGDVVDGRDDNRDSDVPRWCDVDWNRSGGRGRRGDVDDVGADGGEPFDHRAIRRRYQFCGQHFAGVDAGGERSGQGEHDDGGGVIAESVDDGRECDVHSDGDVHDGGDDYRHGDVSGWSDVAGYGDAGVGESHAHDVIFDGGITFDHGAVWRRCELCDEHFAGVTQVVNAAGLTGTTTALTGPATGTPGANLTLTATVTPASGTKVPTGMANFFDGATNIGNGSLNGSGVATFSTTSLAAGMHSITAQYGGDNNIQVPRRTRWRRRLPRRPGLHDFSGAGERECDGGETGDGDGDGNADEWIQSGCAIFVHERAGRDRL